VARKSGRLAQQGALAARDDVPALVHRDGAETALAVAAAVGGEGEADGLEGLDGAVISVKGVDVAGIRQLVDPVEGLRRGGRRGRVLDEVAGVLALGERRAVSGSAFS
jgi:hypothetical protein